MARAVVRGLRERGADVLTVQEAGLLGGSDEQHLERARSEARVLVTQDEDFLSMHAAGVEHTGIAYAPQGTSIGAMIRGLMLMDSGWSWTPWLFGIGVAEACTGSGFGDGGGAGVGVMLICCCPVCQSVYHDSRPGGAFFARNPAGLCCLEPYGIGICGSPAVRKQLADRAVPPLMRGLRQMPP